VLCEVHNTFKEQHSYLCARDDRSPITGDDWLVAEKLFHVSPFIEREGSYRFRFDYRPETGKLGIWIDYYNAQTQKLLLTSLTGSFLPYNRTTRRHAFWQYPLMTLQVIWLIHWQALKLCAKRIRYVRRSLQINNKISVGGDLTKNLGNGQLVSRNEVLDSSDIP
jgi:DUF1365 family protein